MTEEIQVKLSVKRAAFAAAIAITAVAIYISYPYIHYYLYPVNTYDYYGNALAFRSDLRQAQDIPVYPAEAAITGLMLNPFVRNVTIVFQSTSQNGLVSVEAYEIAYKLQILYLVLGRQVGISAELVNSTVYGNVSDPVVFLAPPPIADGTGVMLSNSTIIISATTQAGMDEATDRFLMVTMGIKV